MSLFRRRGGTILAHQPGDDEFAVRLSNGGWWPDVRLWGLPPGDLLRIWEADPDGYWRRSQEEARALAERISAEREARRRAAFWARVWRTFTPWRNHGR